METKKDKFVRVAESRTNKLISMIRLLGNCSNKAVYEYTDKDVKKIFNALESELKAAKSKFLETSETGAKFKL
jgi:hypothetical protein